MQRDESHLTKELTMCERTNDLKAVKRQVIALKKIYNALSTQTRERYLDDNSDQYALGKSHAYLHAADALDDLRVTINTLIDGEAE